MLIRTFVLKVINNKRRKLTHHKIINRIAEQIVLVITQVSKQSKLWVHPNLRRPSFLFTFSFKFTYFCIVYIYINLKKGILLKKIRNFVTNLHNREALRKLHMQLGISSCLGYGRLTYKATIYSLKPMFFFPIDTAL